MWVPPMRSVEPKVSCITSGPSQSIQCRISHGGQGEPEVSTNSRLETSRARRSSSGRRAMRSIIVGTRLILSTRWRSIRRRHSAGSNRASTTAVAPARTVRQAVA